MKFDKKDITKETLKNLRSELNYNNAQMADLLGISEKTWKNKISGEGKISKLEYEFM
ncbi:antitoxin Xre-like helix-turn-helix domain-containing protein, partial [Proteus mirabilis]|uniref:antitoxin Xre-like helix-turn-helix domain-containing protein n=2 Tax=Gammaproteobacteria TaxID=1236 RepID=UPI003315577A